jgi:hypothetical protein
MPDEVLAKGKLIKPDGSVWAAATVTCTFVHFSTTPTTQHPPERLTATTASDGSYSFLLWRNELGDYASHYLFKFPNDKVQRKAIVTIDTPDEVEISQLLVASTPPGDPTYPSLIALINNLFAAGNFAGTADIIPLNPTIPGLGGTVQSAIAAQQAEIAANHTAILALQGQPLPELKSLPDLSMAGAAEGAVVAYNMTFQGFELRNDLQNIVIDGGNF